MKTESIQFGINYESLSRFRQTLLQGEAQYHHPLIQGKDQLLTGQKLLVLDLEKPP